MNINNKFWNKKKVFITGHTGFKGSWLCIFLSMLGAEITGFSLKPKTKPSLFELAGVSKIIKKSVISDIRNYKKLYNEIKKSNATIIFHLASQPLVSESYLNPRETFDVNFIGALNVLESIRNIKKIKTSIIITSDKVYDINKNKIFKETDLLGGIDPYSSSKVSVETLFAGYINSFFNKEKDQMLATVRAGNVIGGGDYSKDRLIPDIYRYYRKNKKIRLRNPNAIRPWQHVLEPLSGYILLAEKIHDKKIRNLNQNWNFGPNLSNCKTVGYVAKYLAKALKSKKIIIKNKNKSNVETDILRLDNKKSKKYLNWYPKWNLDKTLKKIYEWEYNRKRKKTIKTCRDQINDFLQ